MVPMHQNLTNKEMHEEVQLLGHTQLPHVDGPSGSQNSHENVCLLFTLFTLLDISCLHPLWCEAPPPLHCPDQVCSKPQSLHQDWILVSPEPKMA